MPEPSQPHADKPAAALPERERTDEPRRSPALRFTKWNPQTGRYDPVVALSPDQVATKPELGTDAQPIRKEHQHAAR